MAFITELDIVNSCLKSMGRSPINSLTGGSPIIASALGSLRTAMMEQQGIGWWFNIESLSLDADTDGFYYIPADTLAIIPDANPAWMTSRGSRIYDTRVGDYYTGQGKLKVTLTRLIPLDDLPYQAQRLVECGAVLDFQKAFDADQQKVQMATDDYETAFGIIRAQHIRSVKANMLRQGAGGIATHRQRRIYGRDERYQ